MGKKRSKRKRAFYNEDEDGNENPQVGGRSIEANNALEKNRTQEYLDSRKDELLSFASDTSQKVRQAQEEMVKVKKKAEQMEASILKEEEAMQSGKRKVEEEYAKKFRELEARSLQKRDQLVNVKEEVKRIQVKM